MLFAPLEHELWAIDFYAWNAFADSVLYNPLQLAQLQLAFPYEWWCAASKRLFLEYYKKLAEKLK